MQARMRSTPAVIVFFWLHDDAVLVVGISGWIFGEN